MQYALSLFRESWGYNTCISGVQWSYQRSNRLSRTPDEVSSRCLSPEQAELIRAELERVLGSQQFRSSRRCQSLLRHITEHTLADDGHALKERTLGVEVFGRTPDYDTNQDPIVRATAAEVRKKLAQYYQDPAHETEARIELVAGSYIPEFHTGPPPPQNGAVQPEPTPEPARWRLVAVSAGGIVALALAVLAAIALIPRWGKNDVERFWGPMFQAPGTVLFSMGQPVTYNLFSAQAQDNIQFEIGKTKEPPQGVIPRKDLIILPDRYVALGDAVCLVRLTSLFEKRGKAYRIRGERTTTFADLRENPAVLIAAFDNPWTLRAAGELRFTFVKDSAHDTDMVRDREHPENTQWKLTGAWPYWDIPNDYAIVSRVLDLNTDRPVVIAAGITQYGTMAAGEFLSNPEYFSEAVAKLPHGWEKRNLQIVLRVPVVHGASGHPRVLDTHVW